ncbi:MAG TPA: Rab family GTPase [Thermomicrobiales bacterium]|jgi:signal recognition particle receptor subunit beta|nr:Rab family GTPase [Thermomicrobiales bacterium]
MAMIDLDNRQIVAKIVVYGPGQSGKTTFLRAVHDLIPESQRPQIDSIESDSGRTLLYDSLPLDAGTVGDYRMRFQLFSVAGNEGSQDARQAVLSGADGVVFLADAQPDRLADNQASFDELMISLAQLQKANGTFPVVIQYNKVDLVDEATLGSVSRTLNSDGLPEAYSSALNKRGVVDSLQTITRLVAQSL